MEVISKYSETRKHPSGTKNITMIKYKCVCSRECVSQKGVYLRAKSCGCRSTRNLIGERFGMLLVTGISGPNNRCKKGYMATCNCGKIRSYTFGDLIGKSFQSCGCLQKSNRGRIISRDIDKFDPSVKVMKGHPLQQTYMGAWYRCNNKKSPAFKHYGGRGIKFLWTSFEQFCEDMGPRPEGYSIERLNVNGHYCKDNCIWADDETQANNMRDTVYITHNDITLSVARWRKKVGISEHAQGDRRRSGWSVKDSCTTPILPPGTTLEQYKLNNP